MTLKERLIALEENQYNIGELIGELEARIDDLEEQMHTTEVTVDSLSEILDDMQMERELAEEPEDDWEVLEGCDCQWCKAKRAMIAKEMIEKEPKQCDCSMCREAREAKVREEEMERTKLCDVYEDCLDCPECDVCFDAVIDEDTEQLLEEGCDICDDCDNCPLEELCSDKCDELMRKYREGL